MAKFRTQPILIEGRYIILMKDVERDCISVINKRW